MPIIIGIDPGLTGAVAVVARGRDIVTMSRSCGARADHQAAKTLPRLLFLSAMGLLRLFPSTTEDLSQDEKEDRWKSDE
jgi:hypothetical protein